MHLTRDVSRREDYTCGIEKKFVTSTQCILTACQKRISEMPDMAALSAEACPGVIGFSFLEYGATRSRRNGSQRRLDLWVRTDFRLNPRRPSEYLKRYCSQKTNGYGQVVHYTPPPIRLSSLPGILPRAIREFRVGLWRNSG